MFLPNISPLVVTKMPIRITAAKPSADTRGKEKVVEPDVVEVPSKNVANEEPSAREMDEILKIIKRSDFKIVEQLGKTPSKISMLSLLLCSDAHARTLIKFLKKAHVPHETTTDQFENCVASLKTDNGLGFSDADLTPLGKNHNKALHVSVK